jgi:hypothetical protein
MSSQPPVTPPANPNPAANPNPTTNLNPEDKKKSEDRAKESQIRSAAFWIIIVALLILWLVGWRWYGSGPWIHLLPAVAMAALLVQLSSGRGNSKNIDAREEHIPKWDPAQPEVSLTKIHEYVLDEAAKSTRWYWRNKGSKALGSQVIRFSVWALAAVGGLLPVLGALLKELKTSLFGLDLSNGLWASLLLGIAAALLGLDKGFGFSSGWARYVLTATNIRKSLEEFRMDWANLMAKAGPALIASSSANAKPSPDAVTPLIDRAKQFRSDVEGLVLQETKDWVTEFQSTMAQMEKDVAAQLSALKTQVDKTIQAQQEASKGGAIHLTVTNSSNALPGSLKVAVVNNESKTMQEEYLTVDSWTSKFLPPGIYQVKLDALFGSPPTGTAPTPQIVTVKTGEVATVKFNL